MSKQASDGFTPMEELMLDVLTTRIRLGHNCWTFHKKLTKTAKSLEAKGLLAWKSGVIQNTIIVFPGDVLRDPPFMDAGYVSPRYAALQSAADAILDSVGLRCDRCLGMPLGDHKDWCQFTAKKRLQEALVELRG